MPNDRFDIYVRWAYLVAIAVSLFTGIGNMPMWGRFFVADIPGFGWSGNFFVNMYVHYLSGALLLTISSYYIFLYSQRSDKRIKISAPGVVRGALLGLVLISGLLSAIKNLAFVDLPLTGLMALVFLHLGSAMAFIFFALVFWLRKKPWMITS
jgi:hypothetical protein